MIEQPSLVLFSYHQEPRYNGYADYGGEIRYDAPLSCGISPKTDMNHCFGMTPSKSPCSLLCCRPLILISKSLTCFRRFSSSLSRSLRWDHFRIWDVVFSPYEDPSLESTLISCPSCMCYCSFLYSLSSLLRPYDEALEWFPAIEPFPACGPSMVG